MCSLVHVGNIGKRAEDDAEVEAGRQKDGSLFGASFPFLSSLLLLGRREDALKLNVRGLLNLNAIYSRKCYFSQEIILNGLQIASF